MRTHADGPTLRVTDLDNLGATTAPHLRELVRASLLPEQRFVEIDFSRVAFVDSEGMGALISAHKAVASRGGRVRLIGASDSIRQLFRLTRLDELFDLPPGT